MEVVKQLFFLTLWMRGMKWLDHIFQMNLKKRQISITRYEDIPMIILINLSVLN